VSGMFEQPRRPQQPPRPPGRPGRSRAIVITAAVLLAAFIALTAFSSFWTERLWFDAVGFSTVFTTLLWTRVGLFLVFGALMAAAVALNIVLAHRFRPWLQMGMPDQAGLERYRQALVPVGGWVVAGVSLLVGAFAGASAAGQWREFTLWRNSVPFGTDDPYFEKDAGFYVFDLPWWHYLTDFAMAMAVIGLMAAALVHYLYGGIRLAAPARDRLSGAAQVQLSVLLGIFVLAKAVDYWLDRYDLVHEGGALVTGMTYTRDNAVLPAKNILAGIALICAILFFVNVWRRTWTLPSVGLALLVISAILLGMIWPGAVQQFQVSPTEADKEEPYIARNIEATREAYALDGTEVEAYSGEPDLPDRQLATAAIDSPGIRLVDPQVVQQTFEQRQQVRGYYSVPPVLDVDNYTINGEERDVVLAVRELNQAGISSGSQNWANLRTVYTHGYGVIAAYGNQRPASNETVLTGQEPAWAEIDIPPRGQLSDLSEEGYEPRIYFGENSPSYSIVGKESDDARDIELDLPGGSDAGSGSGSDGSDNYNTYGGGAGVGVGSFFNKLLYAVKFGEPNIVLSGRVHENSTILYDRDPARRLEKVAPWLTVDGDPFPAVVDGRVVWLLDGYTVTDKYPLSQRGSFEEMTDDSLNDQPGFQTLPTDEINYMRNAVKATVDAYTGEVTLYEWDEEDPILQAWTKAFPGTVEPREEIPESILEHMRYPEDMFKVQRYQLASYHVTDAADFYEANDRWEVPTDPNNPGSLQPPYRLSVPSQNETDTFSLTSVYTPVNRENLAAFVSVDADAAEDGYGTIRIKRLSSSSQIPGPGQIANQIQSDQAVTDVLLPYSRETNTRVVNGNLLTLPVGGGLLYVQPLYSLRTSGEGNFPVLRFIAVSFGDEVGVGRTLGEAIYDVLGLFGTPSDSPGGGGQTGGGDPGDGGEGEPTGTVQDQIRDLLDQADQAFADADEAQRDGDLVEWARLIEQARSLIDEAIGLASETAAEGSGSEGGSEGGSGDSAEGDSGAGDSAGQG
jgi:uncharacterized protein